MLLNIDREAHPLGLNHVYLILNAKRILVDNLKIRDEIQQLDHPHSDHGQKGKDLYQQKQKKIFLQVDLF